MEFGNLYAIFFIVSVTALLLTVIIRENSSSLLIIAEIDVNYKEISSNEQRWLFMYINFLIDPLLG
jgi:hypothetical protein